MLGIQVHDVGGQQLDIEDIWPLRTLCFVTTDSTVVRKHGDYRRTGLYFIPMLLNEKRAAKAPINWAVVDLLTPFGGIRMNNIRLLPEAAGIENLTRDAFGKSKSQLPILDRIKQQKHREQPSISARH